MKVKQIANLLNDVFEEVLGQDVLFDEDLNNIVSVGEVIISNGSVNGSSDAWLDNYVYTLIDKVGKTIFVDRAFTAKDLGLWRDSWEYASVMEKVRCEVPDFTDNCEWDLANYNGAGDVNLQGHINELFKFLPPTVQSKYFDMKTTFKVVLSIARKQMRSALKSASEMTRFIAMIENRIRMKMELAKQELERRTVVNYMAESLKANSGTIINVAKIYDDLGLGGGTTPATLSDALADPEALRLIAKTMEQYKALMTEPSILYNPEGQFVTFTPESEQRTIILSDVDNALKFNLYGDVYHDEFVRLGGYNTVPFWQGTGTTNDTETRATINVIPASEGPQTATPDTRTPVQQAGIIGVVLDRDAVMVCNEDPEVAANYNADGNFTNYFYRFDCSYYNDLDENGLVFIWDTTGL